MCVYIYLVPFINMSGSPCLYLDIEGRDYSFYLVVTTETYNTLRSSVFFFSAYGSAMEEYQVCMGLLASRLGRGDLGKGT